MANAIKWVTPLVVIRQKPLLQGVILVERSKMIQKYTLFPAMGNQLRKTIYAIGKMLLKTAWPLKQILP